MPATFLDLPPDVRTRIYADAGLVRRDYPVDISLHGKFTDPKADLFPKKRLVPLLVALLRVCRHVHVEAVDTLYGCNKFTMSVSTGPGGNFSRSSTSVMVSLPLYGLARMTWLQMRINGVRAMGDPLLAIVPLWKLKAEAEVLLTLWDQLCARLGKALRQTRAPPGDAPQLYLTVICDVDSEAAARSVVAPMLKELPRLASCTMRLGRRAGQVSVGRVARDTAQTLMRRLADGTDPPTKTTPFPFRRLPAELRAHILEYTDLGSADVAGYISKHEVLRIRNGQMALPNSELDADFDAGHDSDSNGGSGSGNEPTYFMGYDNGCCRLCIPGRIPLTNDCCCVMSYAAFSLHCRCRALPINLFLVDHLMYKEAALDLFYPRATFEFCSDVFLETQDLLSNMSPAALQRIRRMVFTMSWEQFSMWPARRQQPDEDDNNSNSNDDNDDNDDNNNNGFLVVGSADVVRGDRSWRSLVSFIKDHMDVPRLSITLNTVRCVWGQLQDYLMDDDFDPAIDFRHVYDMYMDLATQLCQLKGLGHVRFQFSAFTDMAPWLEREILGAERFAGVVPAEEEALGRVSGQPQQRRRRVRREDRIPAYHDMNKRLEGSNYHPVEGEGEGVQMDDMGGATIS